MQEHTIVKLGKVVLRWPILDGEQIVTPVPGHNGVGSLIKVTYEGVSQVLRVTNTWRASGDRFLVALQVPSSSGIEAIR